MIFRNHYRKMTCKT